MKTKLLLLAGLCAVLLFGACATNPGTGATPGRSVATVRIITSSGVTLALANNPRHVPAVQSLAVAIDAITLEDTVLTADLITEYVAKICIERGLTPAESIVYTSLARTIYTGFLEDHPAISLEKITISNPEVKRYIEAFREGLGDALAVVAAANAAAPTS